MTCSIIWMALPELQLRRRHNGQEHSYVAMRFACSKLPKYSTEVTPITGMLLISAPLLDPVQKMQSLWKWDNGVHIDPKDEIAYTTQYQESLLKYMEKEFCANHWRLPVINLTVYRGTTFSVRKWLHSLVNLLIIHMICPAMLKTTYSLKMWWKWLPDKSITKHAFWHPQGSIRIHNLNYNRTGGKFIGIIMITTPNHWRFAVHCGSRISRTGGVCESERTPSTPISLVWHATSSRSYHMVSQWRPVFPLGEMWSAAWSPKLQERRFAENS